MTLSKHFNRHTLAMVVMFLIAALAVFWMTKETHFYPLAIQSGESIHRFDVEYADTPQKQEQGLMFRKSLDDNKGMLFAFPQNRSVTFWMKNTLIPLDMIFIDASNTISFIHHRAIPHDETPVSSNGPIIAVLEIPGGQAAQQGIHVGDKVKTPLLKAPR